MKKTTQKSSQVNLPREIGQAVISRGREPYLKIPAHILNLPRLGLSEKVLLAHIYSFGVKGCWQSNQTLAEIFMTKERTVSRWINTIRKYIHIKNPKGYYRTMWSKSHPSVKEHMDKIGQDDGQKVSADMARSGNRHGQKCPTTNNNTITENYKRTTARLSSPKSASPSPLPAGGQSPSTLIERNKETQQRIEQFKRNFSRGKTSQLQPMTEEQFENRRAKQLAALQAMECLHRSV